MPPRRWLAALLAAVVAGCAAPPAPPDQSIVAQAQQTTPPVVWARDDGFAAAWIGSDAVGVHHDARIIAAGVNAAAVVLPLPPVHPYDQGGLPAADDQMHLVWLDEGDDGAPALFHALLTPELAVARTTQASVGSARAYSLTPDGDGGLWAAWSGGLPDEPAVWLRRIDRQGRPLTPQRAAERADLPALAARPPDTAQNPPTLYWRSTRTQRISRAAVSGADLAPADDVSASVRLEGGDRVAGLFAAEHASRAWLVWNIVRADGSAETWWTSGTQDNPADWRTPQPLTLADGEPVARLAPPLVVGGRVVAAAWSAGVLRLVALDASGAAALGEIARVPVLLDAPRLVAGASTLYAAWAAPDAAAGYAALRVVAVPLP